MTTKKNWEFLQKKTKALKESDLQTFKTAIEYELVNLSQDEFHLLCDEKKLELIDYFFNLLIKEARDNEILDLMQANFLQ